MKTKQIVLSLLAIGLNCYLACADELTNNPNLRIVRHGNYTYTILYARTNNGFIYINPSEFWPGTWKEDTNGWRVQLCVYPETDFRRHPISTNLMLSVDWGSAVKNSWGTIEKPSGDKYYRTPNGKFAKFELLDANGNVVSPNPNAGTDLLLNLIKGESPGSSFSQKLEYGSDLPAWVSPAGGSLASNFPKTISTNVYPQWQYGGIAGEIGSNTNLPPFQVGFLKLDEIYSVTNEGDYTLTVQPVLYKQRIGTNVLDRVDLPSVTTKVHLLPNVK
jgi:hypothetical protein